MATSPVTPAATHPSFFAKAGTWLLKIGNAIKHGVQKVAGEAPAVTAELQKVAPTAEALSNLFLPGSGSFEAHLLDTWGVLASAVDTAGQAAEANGVSVTLDAQLVAEIKSFLPSVKQFFAPNAGPAPAAK
ncbi:MAG TPA: hypothetical protein VN682_17040 [Terriglobales bacterium]|nr:hypothetical protein [Terriglobales bacterium]